MTRKEARLKALTIAATELQELARVTEVVRERGWTEEDQAKVLKEIEVIAEGLWTKYYRGKGSKEVRGNQY